MIQPGRVCVKIAGRDGNLKCVVVENIDKNYVMIDGETRRRKCNISHLEPLSQTLNIGKGSHEEVVSAFKEFGIEINDKVKKETQRASAPVHRTKGSDESEPQKTAKREEKSEKKSSRLKN